MATTIRLPDLQEGKKVVLFFSGGVNSTLLAYLAKQKYGVENVIPLFNGFAPVRVATTNEERKAKAQVVLANRINSFTKMCEVLGLRNAVVLDSIEKYNFGISNLIRDMHRVNYIEALLGILDENFDIEPTSIEYIMMGHEKLDFEIRQLNELDAVDGVIFNINVNDVAEYVTAHSKEFPEVIKHNVLSRWADWSQYNSFYKLDNDQYCDVGDVKGVTPLMDISKTEIIQMYYDMGLEQLLQQTITCHGGPDYPTPCGQCIPCTERNVALNHVSANTQTTSP